MAVPSVMQAPVSLPRRLGAVLYDGLICLALVLGVGIAATPLIGDSPGDALGPGLLGRALLQAALLGVLLGYFQASWTRGGQTIGMRAWGILLLTDEQRTVTPDRALIRSLAAVLSWAPAGLGFLWALVDPDRLTWHDRLSRTRLVRVSKGA